MKYREIQDQVEKGVDLDLINEIIIPGNVIISRNFREVVPLRDFDDGILVKNQYDEHFVFCFDATEWCSEAFYSEVNYEKLPIKLRHGARIVIERGIEEENIQEHDENLWNELKHLARDGITVKIYSTRGKKPLVTAWAINDDNGYYGHTIHFESGEWKYEDAI